MLHRMVRGSACAVLVCAIVLPVSAKEPPAWKIAARELRPPAGASDELRQAIAAGPAPDVAASQSNYPRSREEWDAILASAAAQSPDLAKLEKRFGVSIEPAEVAGVKVYHVRPAKVEPDHAKQLFLYIHGGAYVFGGGDACVGEAVTIASTAGIAAIAVDYRMPPEHPFPVAVDDVVAVYRHLLKERPPGSIAIGGTSAGGGLSLAAVHRFRALGLPVPGAVYGGTPWADLTDASDSLHTNEGVDRALVTYEGMLGAAARLYAGEHEMTDPLISPVYGDFAGFPPTYLVTGTRDMFLSDTARVHRKLRQAGVVADLNVYEGMSHAEYAFVPDAPESRQVYVELATFLRTHLKPGP